METIVIATPSLLVVLAFGVSACTGALLERATPDRQQEAASFPASAFAAACDRCDDWDKPAPPFQMFGNTYFVGTCGITSILITGKEGHLVIDSGTEAGAEVVAANIEALGTDGLSTVAAPDYRWADHPHYLRDYRASIEWLMGVEADLCLSAHPSQTRLIERINADQLVDSSGCRSAAVGTLNRLEGILAAQP